MEYPAPGTVLTSDSAFYFMGQFLLWSVIAAGALAIAHYRLVGRERLILAIGLFFSFASSFGPLFIRWALSMPGLGGPDAGWEEFWLSFTATFPQAVAFALLLWVALRGCARGETVQAK